MRQKISLHLAEICVQIQKLLRLFNSAKRPLLLGVFLILRHNHEILRRVLQPRSLVSLGESLHCLSELFSKWTTYKQLKYFTTVICTPECHFYISML